MSADTHGFGQWQSCPPCSGDCQQGRTCDAQEACAQMSMWDDERESPWLLFLVYAVALVAMIAASFVFPIWF